MAKSFDRVADIYDETRRMPPDVLARIMENISREVDPSSGPVLELGIGTGRIALPLAERGFRIVGVDVGEKMLARLRENLAGSAHSVRGVRGDVVELPFEAGSFSAVLAVHVFHLLDDVEACLEETRRVLLPGGCLLFGGEQRLFRYIEQVLSEQYGVREDLIGMLREAGIKLPDQDEVKRDVSKHVGAMGGDFAPLEPAEWDSEISCADIADRIEKRIASYLWQTSEEGMNRLVTRLRAILEAHVGPPPTLIRFRRKFEMFRARFPS